MKIQPIAKEMIQILLESVSAEIEEHMFQMEQIFVPGMKLTFIARHPDTQESEYLYTSDKLEDVLKTVQRMIERNQKKD